jgi:WD40 repeat protein
VYRTSDGARLHTLKGHTGAVFALAFHPTLNRLLTAGFDGQVRAYGTVSGCLLEAFLPVTLEPAQPQASAALRAR